MEAIWTALFPATAPYHAPAWSVRSMVAHAPDLFFVAEIEGEVVGTVLAGWDGHRGWIYSLGVRPDLQRGGIGSALLAHAVEALRARGCPKVNLQIRGDNRDVVGFYERLGLASRGSGEHGAAGLAAAFTSSSAVLRAVRRPPSGFSPY